MRWTVAAIAAAGGAARQRRDSLARSENLQDGCSLDQGVQSVSFDNFISGLAMR